MYHNFVYHHFKNHNFIYYHVMYHDILYYNYPKLQQSQSELGKLKKAPPPIPTRPPPAPNPVSSVGLTC